MFPERPGGFAQQQRHHSEREAQSATELTFVWLSAGDRNEAGRIGNVAGRVVEMRSVGQIVSLHPKHELPVFGQPERLKQRKIRIHNSGPAQNIAPTVSEASLSHRLKRKWVVEGRTGSDVSELLYIGEHLVGCLDIARRVEGCACSRDAKWLPLVSAEETTHLPASHDGLHGAGLCPSFAFACRQFVTIRELEIVRNVVVCLRAVANQDRRVIPQQRRKAIVIGPVNCPGALPGP
jgi:hypothetical protein